MSTNDKLSSAFASNLTFKEERQQQATKYSNGSAETVKHSPTIHDNLKWNLRTLLSKRNLIVYHLQIVHSILDMGDNTQTATLTYLLVKRVLA